MSTPESDTAKSSPPIPEQGPLRFLDALENAMKGAGAVCLFAMALVTGADIVGRMFDRPIFGSEEIVTMLATLTVAMSLPYAHTEKSHIGVELFLRFIPKAARRVVKLSTDIAALALFGVVTWRMADYGLALKDSGEVSMNLEFPEYWVVFVLACGFAVFTLAILRDVLAAFSAKSDRPAARTQRRDA